MFEILPIDIIQHIIEYISIEVVIYLFPDKMHNIDYKKYNYSWAMNLIDTNTRIRVLTWLIKYNYIPLDAYVLDRLSALGNVYLINKIFRLIEHSDLNTTCFYTHRAVDWACSFGHLEVLDWWWKNTTIDYFKYTTHTLDSASVNGHLKILNWWKKRYIEGVILKYTRDAVDRTIYTTSLDWWLEMYHKYDLPIKYSTKSIDLTQDIQILNWWLNSYLMYGTKLKYKKYSINYASGTGNVEILNWWRSTVAQHPFISIKYDESAIDCASQNGHLHILEWWLKQHRSGSGFKFIYTNFAIDSASQNGHLNILEWWFKQYQKGNCLLKRSVHAVNNASRNGHLHVLNWWLNLHIKHNIPMLYDLSALEWSLDNTSSLNWWIKMCNQHRFVFQRIHWNQYYSCIE
jgi:hypothetical protein